jgi:predicted O-methyltransferase YrrM
MLKFLRQLATKVMPNRDAVARKNALAIKPKRNHFGPEEHMSKLYLGVDSDIIADIRLIERFCLDWQANAYAYRQALRDLRSAAQRLLPLIGESTADRLSISPEVMEKVRNVGEEVACLARQPLYFPEMFHGVRLLPDGSFSPLTHSDAIHLRAGGLLGIQDRVAIGDMYKRIFRNRSAPLRVVEIGSAVGGGSTRIAGDAVKRSGGTLYCIDEWAGSMYFAFLANMRIHDLEATVMPIRGPSVDAAVLFDDGSLDAVFVDGNHIYPNVLADIDAYLPKVRKNGYIFGHDLFDLPSRFDRRELLSVSTKNNTEVNHTNSEGEVQRIDVHPGVILAVQDRFGDDVELFPGSVVWARQV